MKLITIIGARPQIIKSAALSNVLSQESSITEYVIHTGQHYDYEMSEFFFKQLNIRPPYCNLGINQCASETASVASMITVLEHHIQAIRPNAVIVFGDTNSTLAGAISAAKNNIPVVHIEAGLRSFNMNMQEEINRVITDSISSLAFCPSEDSFQRLIDESASYPTRKVINSGDILVDSILACRDIIGHVSLPIDLPPRFILATIHRAENVDDPEKLTQIINGLNRIHEIVPVVFPLHPRTKSKILAANLELRMNYLPPIGYFEALRMITQSEIVITDSGGLQREAYYLQRPSIVIRERSEWIELTNCGYSSLSSPNETAIISAFEERKKQPKTIAEGLYGTGHTAQVICREIISAF